MNILTKFKDLTLESLKDNKKLIIGLYILFIAVFIMAWAYGYSKVDVILNLVDATNSTATDAIGSHVSALDLFINNEIGGIVTYVGSVVFAIPAIVLLVYNAYSIGSMGPFFGAVMSKGSIQYIIYLIPHGIFEISATVLESVAGVLLFLFIWRFFKAWRNGNGAFEAFGETKKILIQSFVIFVFSTILLVIAAPIESYFSVPFSNFIVGLL